ncbi:hypothetical protein HF1_03400 [Mycoplasma haemofelis str. Langford 1]|uniref:Uncharacterized protein n=1 Tax=Mycoplasma haemofelis (strain Langford 1) TaxID=941640 RepID=E8ZGS7_MYCHL|nr:hypothetical protein [Mycoplasma haemofelis]CBY92348.1 hypothetical protein HF1_03400 [Mycoplasma haemofelis str. Langford 1]
MSKLIPASLGVLGAGGAGAGGYFLAKSSGSENVATPTFRVKYEKSLLNFEGSTDEKSWGAKFTSLKSGTKNHPDLKTASATDDETTGKSLHKEACRKIYDSPSDNHDYFEDFKKYCSKLIEDVVDGTWITDDSAASGSSNKWDGKLTNLKSNKSNLIHQKLKDLSNKLTGSSFDATNRKELKDWCSTMKSQLFLGESENVIKEIKSYCAE